MNSVDVLHARRGGGHQHHGLRGDQADGGEVLDVVLHGLVDQPGDGDLVAGADEQRVAVRRGADGLLRANGAAGAAHVLDHHRHAELLGQRLAQRAAGQVGAAAGRVADDEGDGPVGVRRLGMGGGGAKGQGHAGGGTGRAEGGRSHVGWAPRKKTVGMVVA
jgi:hypothetical protein